MTFTAKKRGDHWIVNGNKHGKMGNSIFKMSQYLRIGFDSGTISHRTRGHHKFMVSGYVVDLNTILGPLLQMREVNHDGSEQGIGYENTTPHYQLANMWMFENEQ